MDPRIDVYDREHLRTVTPDRRRCSLRTLAAFHESIRPRQLTDATAADLTGFLTAGTLSPGTLRKHRGCVIAAYSWAYGAGFVSADTLLTSRGAPCPATHRRTGPHPYTRRELRAMWEALDRRWPRPQPEVDLARLVDRWNRGTGTYAAFRPYAIRLQLEAIFNLALCGCMRRREIADATTRTIDPVSEYLVAGGRDGDRLGARIVPHGPTRDAIGAWVTLRDRIAPDHEHLWLALWAEPTARQPLRPERMNLLLSTYLLPGLSYRRLRDTGAVAWAQAGLPLPHLQAMLGLSSIVDVLPYAQAVGGNLEKHAERLEAAVGAALLPSRVRASVAA